MNLLTWQTTCVVHASVLFSGFQDRSVEKVVILFAIAKGNNSEFLFFSLVWLQVFRHAMFC